jgi:hypothetical protein
MAEALGVHPAAIDNPATAIHEDRLESNPSAIIGTNVIAPLTMAAAYAGVANHGIYCKPIAVDSITNAKGEALPGQTQECSQAIDSEVAATAAYALQNNMKGYAGNPKDGTPIMGKTGTTDSSNQTWLVSSTTAVTTAVWFGNIVGDYAISRYPGGINNRHAISKPILAAIDTMYAGGAFDAAAPRLLTGAGITAPDFVGGTAANAQTILASLKLTYADGGAEDSALAAGAVTRTDPAAGTVMARGQTVTVFTSNGALKAMPDVVSAGSTADQALVVLNTAGFTSVSQVCVALDAKDALKENLVVSSNPAPGTVMRLTDTIKLGVGHVKC